MNEEFQQYEKIEAYLAGKLQEPDRIAFEQKMENNSDFAQEVEYHQMAQSFIVEKRLLSIQEHCQTLRPKSRFSWKKKSLLIALLSIVSVSSSYWIYSSVKKDTTQKKITLEVQNKSLATVVDTEHTILKLEENKKEKISYSVPHHKKEKVKKSKKVFSEKKEIKEVSVEEKQLENNIVEKSNVLVIKDNKKDSIVTKAEIFEENHCHDVHISMNCTTYDACDNIADGKLIIAETQGGTAPYKYSLDKTHYYQMTEFGGLVAGHYIVWVKDANGCIIKSNRAVEIKPKECKESEEFLLNPLDEYWEIPFDSEQDAILKIVDTHGTVVYSLNMDSHSFYEWDGRNLQGIELSLGMYIYLIEYNDGRIDKGYITLVR